MLRDERRRASYPRLHYHVADKRGTTCSPILMASGPAHLCRCEQGQLYCAAEVRWRACSPECFHEGRGLLHTALSSLSSSGSWTKSSHPLQQPRPRHLTLGGSRTSASARSSLPPLFKSAFLPWAFCCSLSHMAILYSLLVESCPCQLCGRARSCCPVSAPG